MTSTKSLFDIAYRAVACTPNQNTRATDESHRRIRSAMDSLKKLETETGEGAPTPAVVDAVATLLETVFDEKQSSLDDRAYYLDQIRNRAASTS